MIRKKTNKDINPAAQLWLEEIKKAHYFVPESYWDQQLEKMRDEYIAKMECYVYEKEKLLTGLIILDEDACIIALVVRTDFQRQKIGSELLEYAKGRHEKLFASVARMNPIAIDFFKERDFVEQYMQRDVNTNEEEIFFCWEKSADKKPPEELIQNGKINFLSIEKVNPIVVDKSLEQAESENCSRRKTIEEKNVAQADMSYLNKAPKGTALGLYSISNILRHLGNPEKNLKFIHVGGTNGKGSTCTFISEMLIELGYRVGLYTSPYLESFHERIQINRKNISDEELASALEKTKLAVEKYIADGNPEPTEFEITTALAYQYYMEQAVDFVVLEVGLGGELDATNTIDPILSVITSISIDHVDYLGDDLIAIARTKSKIIKPNRPAVLYHQAEELEEQIRLQAKEMGSELFVTQPEKIVPNFCSMEGQSFDVEVLGESFEDIFITLAGEHQQKNFATALTAIKVLEKSRSIRPILPEQIKTAAARAKWKGRAEIVCKNPLTILDGAHNVDGAHVLARYIDDYLAERSKLLVIGMLQDKDIEGVVSQLAPLFDKIIITEPDNPRAIEARELAKVLSRYSSAELIVKESIPEAVEFAQQLGREEKLAIIYAGSLYMIGAARTKLRAMYELNE